MDYYGVLLALLVTLVAGLTGCSAKEPSPEVSTSTEEVATATEETATPEVDAPVDPYSENGDETNLAPIVLEPFTVKALHIGELAVGHFNLYIDGGDPAVVRAWVGDESASDVMVTKAEFEVNHHCAHIEVPSPLPADARLWVELETADGKRMKGSAVVQ